MKKVLYLFLFFVLVLPVSGICQTLTFSSGRGFYEAPFQLTITSSLAEGTIRYTTDGSEPTTSHGNLYSGPIAVNATSVVRAIGYSGATVTPVATHTYLFLDGVINQPATIAGWPNNVYALGGGTATAVHDYAMDPKVVNNPAYNGLIRKALTDIPTMSLVLNKNEFWQVYDADSSYQTSVEIFYPDGTKEQFNCQLESHSHNRLKRSLKLDINKKVTSNLLRSAPFNNAATTTTFKDTKIVLRGGNNRSWARNWAPNRTEYTRDEWYRVSQQAISGTGGRGTFVHLYINGLYWGLYNPVERTDDGMLANYFGGNEADWMTMDHDGIRQGDPARYFYLVNTLIKKDMATAVNYAELRTYLDVEKFSDYLILTWMMGMSDWPTNNYHAAMRNVPAGPFFYHAWDGEWSWDGNGGANDGAWVHPQFRSDAVGTANIARIWHAVRRNPEFMQTFADRVYKHCFNNGPLTDAASRQRWAAINNYVHNAVIAESARWGDAVGDGVTRTRDTHWTPEVNRIDKLMDGNVTRFINALVAQGYYPSLAAPAFNHQGGEVAAGFQLTLSNPNASGTIYYTTDGSDPQAGGAISPAARAYAGPIAITGSVTVKARVYEGSTWSARHEASFTLSGLITGLYINEFMATNTKEADEFGQLEDWIEIYNANTVAVNIGGLYITDNLSQPTLWQIPTTDPVQTTIPAKGFIRLWADNQPTQGPLHVNLKLGASGEQLGLSQMVGGQVTLLDSYTFAAQTADVSEGRSTDGGPTFKKFTEPTPGSTNVIPFKTNLFINEVVVHNQTGLTDEAGERNSWIEIYNNNEEPVNIGGLYLTNNLANPSLWRIPNTHPAQTTIPAKGFITLWADNQPAQGARHLGFTLPASGEIGLANINGPDMLAVDAATYTSQPADVSWGRYPDGSKQVKSFANPTPAAANTIPLLSHIFINEFMASNTTLQDPFGEFDDWIEIYNAGTEPVDIGGMYITDVLTNPRKYQIPTTDPAATTIPAKGFLLLWADEQGKTQGAAHVGIKLGAGGEQIGLFQPNGAELHALDTLTFGAQQANISWGRQTDGSAALVSFPVATPAGRNAPVNSAPTAQAGPNQAYTLPGAEVRLAGAATDPDGSISHYSWIQVSGPNAATLSSATEAQPSLSGLTVGTYVFRLTVTDNAGATASDEVRLEIRYDGPMLVSFTLVDAATQQDIRTLAAGDTLKLAELPTKSLNIRANTQPAAVGSVAFNLSGTQHRTATETSAPYALFGDNQGIYNPWVPAPGAYTLTGTPFTGPGGSGTAGLPLAIAFEVVSPAPAIPVPTANAGIDQVITLPTTSVTLTGAGTGGVISSYSWNQVSGPSLAEISDRTAATPTVSGLIAGMYVFSLTVANDQGAASAPDQVTITVNPDPVTPVPPVAGHRINAGGGQVSTPAGTFSADAYFVSSPSYTFSTTTAIAGTTDDAIYQTERSSPTDQGSFSYALPVANGSYKVVLHFAELYWHKAGQRVFDVKLENALVLDNYDIVQKAGSNFTATTESFYVQVTDGMLELVFSALAHEGGVDRPKVSALEVVLNAAPAAHAGADQTITLPVSSVTLTGSATDTDGTISSYRWTQVSGPAATLLDANAATLTAGDLTAGSYVFRLTVTDNGGASAFDEVAVTVVPNAVPVADAGPDKTLKLPVSSVVLDGSATDSDGTIASYAWSQVSGPAAALSDATTASLTASALVAGNYVFRLTVTDNGGESASDEVAVTVIPNALPVAEAGADQTITLPVSSLMLTGSATDPDGTISSYAWSQVSGPNMAVISDKTVAAPTVSGLVAGTYVFRLVAQDDLLAASAPDQVTVTVNPDPAIPVVIHRINAGGGQVSTPAGTFSADAYFVSSPSYTFSTSTAIAGTTDDAIYQTERSSPTDQGSFAYALPVANGSYTVVLHFAELYWHKAGQRVFDVKLENALVLDNYDIVQKAGSNFTATTESFKVNVTDGTLDLLFSALAHEGGVDRPKLSAMEVLSGGHINLLPVVQAGSDKTITLPVNSVTLTGSATDSDGTISSYRWTQVSGPAATLTNTTSPNLTASGLAAGSYLFRLTVADNAGASAFDEVAVTVNRMPEAGQQLVSLSLMNADTEQEIRTLTAGETLYLAELPTRNVNIRANTSPTTVGSVKFALSGAEARTVAETSAPYALFGDSNGNYNAWVPAAGNYTLVATPYSEGGGTGTAGTPFTISFQVVNGPKPNAAPTAEAGPGKTITLPVSSVMLEGQGMDTDGTIVSYSWTQVSGPAAALTNASTATLTASGLTAGSYLFRLMVTDNAGATASDEVTVTVNRMPEPVQQVLSFTLMNADTEQEIRTLTVGETLYLAELPTRNVNIRANTGTVPVGSVKFALSGAETRTVTETAAPYALFGDSNGSYNAWVPAAGTYTLVATPYSEAAGAGKAGTSLTITFQVADRAPAARLTTLATGQEGQRSGAAAMPYPNPTLDGRFRVLLPQTVAGEVAYELISASGARLVKGKLQLHHPETILDFDFSRQMQANGLYYLRLEGQQLKHQLKLMRQ